MSNRVTFSAGIALSCLLFSARAETPANDAATQEQLVALIKEVRAQQDELAANQAKIDEKLGAVMETIRQARILSSRTGR